MKKKTIKFVPQKYERN